MGYSPSVGNRLAPVTSKVQTVQMDGSVTKAGATTTGEVWRLHAGEFAWATLMLFLVVVGGEVAVWWGVLTDHLPIWAGSFIATVLAYAGFTVMHEATHGNVHGAHLRWRWLGEITGWVTAALLLAAYPAFRVLHLQHHANTNDPERDPDFWVRGSNPLGVAARCITILLAYEHNFFLGAASKTRAAQTEKRTVILGFVVLLAMLALLIISGLGREALWLWVVPGLLASGVLAFAFDWVPHHPHTVRERFHDTRVLLVPGLTLPMLWQNYHLIHHLYPRIPFYRYGTCFRDLRVELEEKGCIIEGYERRAALPKPFTAPR